MPPPAGKPGPRLSSDGYDIYDTAGAFNIAGGVALQSDGKIVVASTIDPGNAMLLRYTTAGALDTTFGTAGVVTQDFGGSDSWVGIGHTWDGKIVVSGYGGGDFAAARYNSGVGLNQRLYVQQDANYNVTSVSNPAGATVERYRYTPYGQRTVLNDDFTVNANPTTSDYAFNIGHQGLKHDAETNLIYNRARYLHNTLGRFTADDPLGTAYQDGMNLYSYLSSRPTFARDSSGLAWNDGWGEAFAAMFGQASPEVQAAFDQTVNDRFNGLGDSAGIDSLAEKLGGTSHTFDPGERRSAECWGNCMKDKTLDDLIDGVRPLTPIFDYTGLRNGNGVGFESGAQTNYDVLNGGFRTGAQIAGTGWAIAGAFELLETSKGNVTGQAVAGHFRSQWGKTASGLGRAANALAWLKFTVDSLACLKECEKCD